MPNIYDDLNVPPSGETFEEILKCRNVKIERITSSDVIPDKVYKQEQDEWVLLLKGSATLSMSDKEIELKEGDYLFIPSDTTHRVMRTEKGTVWLAVYIG
jgi:cupin 2 domain-containing protein